MPGAAPRWSPMSHAFSLRLVFGALLFVGLELIPWATPTARPVWAWPLLLLGYAALASVLLDAAARFRLREGYGVLALAGLAALAAALLFNPGYALANPPLTWFSRALGALGLGGLLAMLALLRLGRPIGWRGALLALIVAAPLGALWGFWARWSPLALDPAAQPTGRDPLTLALAANAALIGLALALARRTRTGQPVDLRLPTPALALMLLAGLGLLVTRVVTESVDPASALALPVLGLICLGVLYYQQRAKGPTLLDTLPGLPPDRWAVVVAPVIGVATAAAITGSHLPRGAGESDALLIGSTALTAFGFVWLPGVALAIAARAFVRLARADRL